MGVLPRLVATGLGFLVTRTAWAAPPSLPEGEVDAGEPAPPATPAAGPETPPATPPETPAETPTDAPAAGGEVSAEASPTDVDVDASGAVEEPKGKRKGKRDEELDADDPGNVRGRREPMMPMAVGGIGLFNTTLPDVGGKYTFRFRLHTDFFRDKAFLYEHETRGPDQHSRVRGAVTLGFTPAKWGEIFFGIASQANRNERDQPGQPGENTLFALGDLTMGFKAAHRFKKQGIGLGGQFGMNLVSGTERLFTNGVSIYFDALFAVDVRYLTKKHVPFRFTTNIGWIRDQTLNAAPFGEIDDDVTREVSRFGLGANHDRVRMRYAIDFPIRLGKERQFGIDPIVEWNWDVSTREEFPAFGRPGSSSSPLPRSSQWFTLGLRANVVAGLHLDAAVDIGAVSPNYEFGPPVPPWQIMLALGWSFDPNPIVKEVPSKEPPPPPPPAAEKEGRIIGRVVAPDGTGVADARVSFPGQTTTALVTDASGNFTSFRFPPGTVTVQVAIGGTMAKEVTADIKAGADTDLTVQLDAPVGPATGVMQGAFVDGAGKPVVASMRVVGQGVDQTFSANADGLVALELAEGRYEATVSAPGFRTKNTSFMVTGGQEVAVRETLEADAPVETPNVKRQGSSVRLKKGIRYDGNAVAASSHAILDELAAFLNGHPDITVMEIGVHTDDRGAAQKRSDERADSVKNYLVGKGVGSERLVAKGHGASHPVAVNMTSSGRAKNNRTVLTVKGGG